MHGIVVKAIFFKNNGSGHSCGWISLKKEVGNENGYRYSFPIEKLFSYSLRLSKFVTKIVDVICTLDFGSNNMG